MKVAGWEAPGPRTGGLPRFARGGSVTVVVTGDSVGFFSALHGEGFESTQVLRSGPIVVEVAFLPISGDEISWVRCEVVDGVSCTQD